MARTGRPLTDLTGQTFGRWTVLRRSDKRKLGQVLYECQCECGRVATIIAANLKRGRTHECLPCSRRRPMAERTAWLKRPKPDQPSTGENDE